MHVRVLVSYLVGYVSIVVEGFYIERFINICSSKKIFLWDLKRDKSTILCASVSLYDFRRLKEICKKTDCKMTIKEKKGLPFVFNKYRKRRFFVCVLVFFVLTIFALSNFVWNIEVSGNESISKDDILGIASEAGLSKGRFKVKINTKEVVNKLRLERDDLAWVGIELKGTNAIIKIVEADKKPDIIDEEEFCSIVADKPAMILRVNAQNGTPTVSEGDIVKEGDILVGRMDRRQVYWDKICSCTW